MKLEFTVRKFPVNSGVKEQSGLPFGCLLQPFQDLEEEFRGGKKLAQAREISRCAQCFAYINCYCQREGTGWTCALCGTFTDYRSTELKRYGKGGQAVHVLPEIVSPLFEVECPMDHDEETEVASGRSSFVSPRAGPPAYVAFVDGTCDMDSMELFKQALQTCLEAIPSYGLFGLLVFDKQLNVWDVRSEQPVSRSVPLLYGVGPPIVPLEDVMSLDEFLIPVGIWKQRINNALDLLQPHSMNRESNEQNVDRAFGAALQGLLYYFRNLNEQDRSGQIIGNVRVMCMLAGPPSIGHGATTGFFQKNGQISRMTPSIQAPNQQEMQQKGGVGQSSIGQSLPEVVQFYEEAAATAAVQGICFDLYVVSAQTVGLHIIQPLSISTGGQMYLYPSVDSANLPQDVYKRLKCEVAYGGLLRVRTAPEFRVGRCYGRVVPDDQFENLYHMINVHPQDTIAIDFEYMQLGGFSPDGFTLATPVIQVAFQYSVAVNESGGSVKFERRMRVYTYGGKAVTSVCEVMQSCNAEVTFGVLFHKLLRVMHEESISEARALLTDWLIILTSNYNHNYRIRRKGTDADPLLLDIQFEQCNQLQALPCMIYALLMSPLLADNNGGDEWSYLSGLWQCLWHDELCKAVYPLLSSYHNPDKEAYPRHSLSRAAVTASQQHLFLLDAFTNIIVFYAPGCPPNMQFPPPQQSLLRKQVSQLQKSRRVTPATRFIHEDREGIQAAQYFYQYLINDTVFHNLDMGQGYVSFLENIRREVHLYIKQQHME